MDGVIERGPNLNVLDTFGSVRTSPLYNSWNGSVPPEWYSANRRAFTLVDLDSLYGSLLYSRAYGRTAADNISGMTDVATLAAFFVTRNSAEGVDGPIEVVVSTRNFTRFGVETVDVITEDTHLIRTQGALVSPIVDIYP